MACLTGHAAVSEATNGVEQTSFGARSAGMGGADYSVASDTTAMNSNPAGITQINRKRVDAGIGFILPDQHFRNELNDVDAKAQAFPLPVFGYVDDTSLGPWSYGVGAYAQGGLGADLSLKHPVYRDPVTGELVEQGFHSNLLYGKLAVAAAYQALYNLSVGVSVNAGYSKLEMELPFSTSTDLLQGRPRWLGHAFSFAHLVSSPLTLNMKQATASINLPDADTLGYGFKLGLLYDYSENLTFGVAYTSESTLNFKGKAHLDFKPQVQDILPDYQRQFEPRFGRFYNRILAAVAKYGVGIDPDADFTATYDAEVELVYPQKLGAGAAYRPTEHLLLAADITWINWKNSFDKMPIRLRNGNNRTVNRMTGGENLEFDVPLNWKDQWIVAVGAEYFLTPSWTLRAGLNHARNPVPEETVLPIFPAIVETHATLGVGYRWENFQLDTAWEHGFENSVSTNQSLIADEYDQSKNTVSLDTFFVTGSWFY
jgi:long-chain fatty acid transport protein